jgi:Ca-activated chloride channel family protein
VAASTRVAESDPRFSPVNRPDGLARILRFLKRETFAREGFAMRPIPCSVHARAGRLAAALTLLLILVSVPPSTEAQEEPTTVGAGNDDPSAWGAPVALDEIGAGELLWKSERGLIPLPVLHVDVELTVTGVLLGGQVTQSFRNPTAKTIEVVYAFPLPGRAAVHRMEMRIGERIIRSVVRERRQARRTYEQAKASGRKAALVDRHRPNLFTTSAANINPGETVSVILEYLDEVDFEAGSFALMFPLAYVPRFAPDGSLDGADELERAALLGRADFGSGSVPTARIEVSLRPGVELEDVDSRSHEIRHARQGDVVVVRTVDERVPARRDFRLRWTPRLAGLPRPAVFAEQGDEGRYAMLMLFPPIPGSEAGLGLPTETLFVVDVSGSMAGPSIEQARLALVAALDRLRPDDRFNVLKFNDTSEPFRREFEYAEPVSLEAARAWVRGLEAGGGTEIHAALVRGLEMMGASRSSSAQRIIFLTDGAVADEGRLYTTITSGLGEARLHAIGIGPAPNAYLMRKMARFGRGLSLLVGDAGEAGNLIGPFLARLDRPVMTDLALEWDALAIDDAHPSRFPDLYAGEPFVLYGRIEDGAATGAIRLTGHTRAGWIETTAEPAVVSDRGSGIGTRWAQRKVEALMDSRYEGADPEGVRAEVIDTALAFGLVTEFTSLVAVEQTPTGLDESRRVHLTSALPQGGTDGPLRLVLGLALLATGAGLLVLLRW